MEQCDSSPLSTVSSSSGDGNQQDMCRICHCEQGPDLPLISPCYCSGSMRYVHHSCLKHWIVNSGTKCCELCKFPFVMHTKMKSFMKWKKVPVSPIEQRDMIIAIAFFLFMITCLSGSLCMLITATTKEMQSFMLELWIKLVLDVMGFIVAFIVIYGKSKVCKQLFHRWKAFNSIIYIQNLPERRGTVEQQQVTEFSATDEMTTNVLTSEDTRQLSIVKDESQNCQTNSDSTSTNSSGSSNNDIVHDLPSTSVKIIKPEKCSSETAGIMTDNKLLSLEDHSKREFVVIFTTSASVSSANELNTVNIPDKQPARTDRHVNHNIF